MVTWILSGTLSICGVSLIFDYWKQELQEKKINLNSETILSRLKKREELYPSSHSITSEIQTQLKTLIVITVFQRVFDRFIDGIKFYLAKVDLSPKAEIQEKRRYSELLSEIVPLYNELIAIGIKIEEGDDRLSLVINGVRNIIRNICVKIYEASKW